MSSGYDGNGVEVAASENFEIMADGKGEEFPSGLIAECHKLFQGCDCDSLLLRGKAAPDDLINQMIRIAKMRIATPAEALAKAFILENFVYSHVNGNCFDVIIELCRDLDLMATRASLGNREKNG